MKLAIVFDAPRSSGHPFGGVSGTYFERVIAACAGMARVGELDYQAFYAVPDVQPGGKAPPIAVIREGREQLTEALLAWGPDRILSVGAPALNGLDQGSRALVISKERGRMRWWGPDGREVPWLPTINASQVVKYSDLHRDFSSDVYKILTQAEPLPPMEIEVIRPTNGQDLASALALLDGATVIGVDVETTGLESTQDEVLAVGFGATYDDTSGLAVVVDRALLDQGVDDVLWDAVWRKTRRTVGQNFKFDMQFLAPLVGWAPEKARLGDTLLLAHLLDERPNRPTSRVRGLGLKDQVAVRYDHEYHYDEAWLDPQTDEDWESMLYYLGEDVCYTARLWHDLEREALEESPRILEAHDGLLMPVSRALARCEFEGAPVDVDYVRETVTAYEHRIEVMKTVLVSHLPALLPKGWNLREDFNILAPGQVADIMYDGWKMTPDVRKHGQLDTSRSTDKDHLAAAVAKYIGTPLDRQAKWLRMLSRLRRYDKTRTTYQNSILGKVDAEDRIHAGFLIHGTSTGRLSSREPNLQNIPSVDREDSIKYRPMRRGFRPKGGRLWVEVDYSQLELRVAAGLSGDPDLTEVFRSGRDVHMEIATSIFSKPAERIAKGERFLAKAVSFGIIYGRTGKALAGGKEMDHAVRKLGIQRWTEDQADAFIKKFLREYPVLKAWMDRLYEEVPAQGYVETPYGRRRRFPLKPKSRGELNSIKRQAVNTPVQSVASDICLEAMIRIQRGIDWYQLDAQVLFPVHDSICIEVSPEDVDNLEALCRREMERDFEGVPLTVDFEYGPTWADTKAH